MLKKRNDNFIARIIYLGIGALCGFFIVLSADPEKFFGIIAPYVSFLASRWMVILLMIPALLGYLLALRELPAVQAVFMDSLSWAGVVKYFAAIVLLKIIHEAAHSLAADRQLLDVWSRLCGYFQSRPRP